MRNFCVRNLSMQFYKNLVWISLCILICFSYSLFMQEIPNHIYISEGQEVEDCFRVPVTVTRIEESQKPQTEAQQTKGQQTEVQQVDVQMEQAGSVAAPTNHGAVEFSRNFEKSNYDYRIICKLFGVIPIKEVGVTEIPARTLYASGRVIGIYGQTSGVLVLDTSEIEAADGLMYEPAANRIQAGDYILAVDDTEINTKEELAARIEEYCGDGQMVLTVNRKGEYINVAVEPVLVDSTEQKYLLGIWVKDDMAGIGTISYYTAEGEFGALGHGIGDGETGQLLSMSEGSLYQAKILGIVKGTRGTPGELEGIIYYGRNNRIGNITGNDKLGIYGRLDEEDLVSYVKNDQSYEMAYKQEIALGEACILSDVSGELTSYTINITSVDYQAEDSNKGIHLQVTDEALIAQTGGIVQGMSGSPIIQNGKIVGAVTHVLVNDPTKGYGIFIEEMLEH